MSNIIEINKILIQKIDDKFYFFDKECDMSCFSWYKYHYQIIKITTNQKEYKFILKMIKDKNFIKFYNKNRIDLTLSIQNYLKIDSLEYLKLWLKK